MGGGAVFFHLAQTYSFQNLIIADINPELVLIYRTIQTQVEGVIASLTELQYQYHQAPLATREALYYQIRKELNAARANFHLDQIGTAAIQRTAQLLFLNRTCFNGLFRLNRQGEFNVPFGRYAHPLICDPENLRLAAQILAQATILLGDFTIIQPYVTPKTFIYFDPPYRPISKTASFNSYASGGFDDQAQERLGQFFRQLDQQGAYLMLSNSDPQNETPDDRYFERLYGPFQIHKIKAKRAINSNPHKRGEINELLITNYPV